MTKDYTDYRKDYSKSITANTTRDYEYRKPAAKALNIYQIIRCLMAEHVVDEHEADKQKIATLEQKLHELERRFHEHVALDTVANEVVRSYADIVKNTLSVMNHGNTSSIYARADEIDVAVLESLTRAQAAGEIRLKLAAEKFHHFSYFYFAEPPALGEIYANRQMLLRPIEWLTYLNNTVDRMKIAYYPCNINVHLEGTQEEFLHNGKHGKVKAHDGFVSYVFANMIENAVKFSRSFDEQHNTVYKDVDIQVRPADKGNLSITAIDQGIGMNDECLSMVFTPGFQYNNKGLRREYEGLGVGLYTSRQILGIIGGNITITSKPGEGTKTELILPLAA